MFLDIKDLPKTQLPASGCGIYVIIFEGANRCYVGQSKNLYSRKISHFYKLRDNKHKNVYMQNVYNKYKDFGVSFNVLQICPSTELNELEGFWIACISKELLLNLAKVRDVFPTRKETKDKLSLITKNQWANKEQREKLIKSKEHLYKDPNHLYKLTNHLRVIKPEQANSIRELYISGKRTCEVVREIMKIDNRNSQHVVENIIMGRRYIFGPGINLDLINKCKESHNIRRKKIKHLSV